MSADAPNYKDTLTLPQTTFPMRGDLVQNEPKRLEAWENEGLYRRILERRRAQKAPEFILHDGPPFANGDVHMGTALNKLLKDLVVKSKTMSGFAAPFVPVDMMSILHCSIFVPTTKSSRNFLANLRARV